MWFSNAVSFLLALPKGPGKVLSLLATTSMSHPGLLLQLYPESDSYQCPLVHLQAGFEGGVGQARKSNDRSQLSQVSWCTNGMLFSD